MQHSSAKQDAWIGQHVIHKTKKIACILGNLGVVTHICFFFCLQAVRWAAWSICITDLGVITAQCMPNTNTHPQTKSHVHDMITSTSWSLSFVKIWLNYTPELCHKEANNSGYGLSSQLIFKECFIYLPHWSANLDCFDICCYGEQQAKFFFSVASLLIGLNSDGWGSTNIGPSWSCCCIWKYCCIKIYICYLFCWMCVKLVVIIHVFAPECKNSF